MTNNKIAEDYKHFVANLYHCINRNANLDDIAQLVFVDNYCKYLCNKVAWKYHIDSDEIHAQLVLDVLENKLFPNITDGSQKFNGRYFQYRIINIARSLLPHDDLDISDKKLADTLASGTDLAEEVIQHNALHSQVADFNALKQAKIAELSAFKAQISSGQKINLDELSNVIELSTEGIARKLDVPRHKLVRHANQYSELIHKLVNEYMELIERWFAIRYNYLNTISEQYGSLLKVYQLINLDYSYSKFAELANNMTLWQLEEIRLKLEQC